ncbi:Transcription factor TGA6 [Zea mays]|uniref:Transcription factor TGA6 n=1 Tax=Zea mays TaxID=4577 RepID=A0A1D6K115_MAIZE|nr:Transcription factor TGA6 [Zea mays]
MADASSRTDTSTVLDMDDKNQRLENGQSGAMALASNSSDRSDRSDKPMDQKVLRRLAQNREAARKSRLRKKVLLAWLCTSGSYFYNFGAVCHSLMHACLFICYMPLLIFIVFKGICATTREQQAKTCKPGARTPESSTTGNLHIQFWRSNSCYEWKCKFISAGAMTFDLEYSRWQEEENKQINELRTAVNAHASESDLRLIVDGIMAHYDEIFRLKGIAAKADVFHILSGMWKTPAERCFLWLGGFRSSELLKVHAYDIDQIISHRL